MYTLDSGHMPDDPDAWALIPGDFLRGDKFLGAMQKSGCVHAGDWEAGIFAVEIERCVYIYTHTSYIKTK